MAPAMTDRSTEAQLAHFRAKLLARAEELRHDMEASAEARAPVELDQTRVGRLSRMDALQAQAMAQATEERREAELSRIESALARMDEGEYGLCLSCDEPIAEKRLEFDPAATLCVRCAGRA